MKLKKISMTRLTVSLLALFSIAIMACGGGGGSSTTPALSPTPAPPALNLAVSQLDACPRPLATAYVSVTDQDGIPVTTLGAADFTLSEDGGAAVNPQTIDFINEMVTLSVSLLMDYSGSITDDAVNKANMEAAARVFIEQLGGNDEAKIIKFANTFIEMTPEFTSSQPDLIAAIAADPGLAPGTLLYDTLVFAVDDIAVRTKTRRAIIVLTDGVDLDAVTRDPLSTNTLQDVIDDANLRGIPVYVIGLGEAIDPVTLQKLADDTGGTYSETLTSAGLQETYQNLADLLFTDQYILTYNSGLLDDEIGELTVAATNPADGLSASGTIAIEACP